MHTYFTHSHYSKANSDFDFSTVLYKFGNFECRWLTRANK